MICKITVTTAGPMMLVRILKPRQIVRTTEKLRYGSERGLSQVAVMKMRTKPMTSRWTRLVFILICDTTLCPEKSLQYSRHNFNNLWSCV